MMLWRCLVLSLIVACGSKKPAPVDPPKNDVAVAPPAAVVKPLAVVFVVEGHEMWIGNDSIDGVPETERLQGALRPLKEVFAKLPTAEMPAGWTATLVTYGEKAVVRASTAPIAKLGAAALGEQKDYAGVIDHDLVAGVTLGLDELAKAKDARRVLVVIGDGTDTNPEVAKTALTALAKRAAAENVQVVSLIYKGMLSSPANPIALFDPNVMTVNSVDGIGSEVEALFDGFTLPPVVVPGGNSVALVVLMQGGEVWVGNDDIEPAGEPSQYRGALKAIRAAVAKTSMTGFPAGSQGAVLTYDDKVKTQRRMGPIEKLDADALGDQKTYYKTVGTALVSGVRTALAQLGKVAAGRRVLIILGDGSDTNNDAAKRQLRELAKKAAELHVEVRSIIWKGALSDEATVIGELDPTVSTAKTPEELTSQLAAVLKGVR